MSLDELLFALYGVSRFFLWANVSKGVHVS